MRIPVIRRRTSVVGAALLAIGMLAAPVAATAQEAEEAEETTSGASTDSSTCIGRLRTHQPEGQIRATYDFYTGMSAVPSATQLTNAGLEAQCQLRRWSILEDDNSFHPGPIDGYFGQQSQEAMKNLQAWFNSRGAGLDEDGWPGPSSWTYLRHPSA